MKIKKKGSNRVLIFLIVILIILSILSLFIGAHDISINDLLAGNDQKIQVILVSRLPRVLSIIISGFSLSLAGVIIQSISNNKFVSPTTAATMDSAKLGIVICMVLFTDLGIVNKMVIAIIFAILGTILFMKILDIIKFKNSIFVPLVGIMVGNVIGAITDFIAYKYNLMQNVSSFLQGDFSTILKGKYEILYFAIPFVIVTFLYAKKFTIVSLGKDMTQNLGLNYNNVINIGVFIVAVISAIVVVTVGSIPFVGLIIPNIISMYYGDNLDGQLLVIALSGSIFVLACDIIGRIILYPFEIPIGLTVGVIGSFIFLILIVRRQKNAANC